ncbi:hypothetical protein AKJ57_06885 [candidate division MSBL1 archaeon SCGC-AAA259A05]|uniref:Uncharacterized protein n=1 Tax=candidate division MSBL1 archaeon SCGC-AAA259A05 TaxID=1698259 RepID=A0A133U2P5_9EURY|nr:hypothetical protein AKJ57_06885 [candidate division MSBL1 archaeon SCGC-AAA259A05]
MGVIVLKNTEENLKEDPEKAREQTRALLRKILTADDVARMRYRKGELPRGIASKFGGTIAAIVDGIVLEALRNKEIAETIAPVLLDKIENGWGNPVPWAHILQILAYWHRLEIEGEVQDPAEIVEAYRQLKSRMDLDNIEERKAELEEEFEEKIQQLREKWEKNLMFG